MSANEESWAYTLEKTPKGIGNLDIDRAEESTLLHYDALAPYSEEMFGGEVAPINEAIRRWIGKNVLNSESILDFGCGIGSYSIPAAKLVGESGQIYALDIHPIAIERVNKRITKSGLTNIKTIQSGLDTGLDNESLDHVLLLDVYSWIPNKAKLLKELHRVLKPEGKLSVLIDHMAPSEFMDDIERANLFSIELQDDNFFILSRR